MPDRLRLVGFDVGVEQGSAHNREGQAGHLVMHVDGLAVSPPLSRSFGLLHHDLTVGLDPMVMEDRLDQPPLAPVNVSLAGEEVLPNDALGRLHGRPLHEGLMARNEHVTDVVGMVEQPRLEPRQAKPHHVTQRGDTLEQPDRISAPGPERLEGEQPRSGRLARHRHNKYYGTMF